MKAVRVKKRKYSVTLNERDIKRLTVYAQSMGIGRSVALSRLVKASLKECQQAVGQTIVDERQLGLFDSVQIDIFNNTSKTVN